MNAIVVDASVVATAFFPEPLHQMSVGILASGQILRAPDLLLAEVGNVVWKRHGRSELTAAEAESLLGDTVGLPIEYAPSMGLVSLALSLALRTGRTVYDCLYLALAVSSQTILVTADQRFVNGLTGTPFAASVRWLGEP